MQPVLEVRRISCSGIVSSAAVSMASGVGGSSVAALVRGSTVMLVGR